MYKFRILRSIEYRVRLGGNAFYGTSRTYPKVESGMIASSIDLGQNSEVLTKNPPLYAQGCRRRSQGSWDLYPDLTLPAWRRVAPNYPREGWISQVNVLSLDYEKFPGRTLSSESLGM